MAVIDVKIIERRGEGDHGCGRRMSGAEDIRLDLELLEPLMSDWRSV